MKKPLLIYGAGGLGREILSLITLLDEWEPRGFVDDGLLKGSVVKGLEVFGGAQMLQGVDGEVHVVLAFGDPVVKAKIAAQISSPKIKFPVLIHPRAILQDNSSIQLGGGTIITAGCILTADVNIGQHVLVNLNVTVGHDSVIGDYCSIMPGVNIGGEVYIGSTVLIGTGANIRNGVTLGTQSTIGMGAAVISDVPEATTVVGVPAKVLSR